MIVGLDVDVRVAVAEGETVDVAARVGKVVGVVVGVGVKVGEGDGGGVGGENDAPRAPGLLFRTSSMANAVSISTITTMGATRDGCSCLGARLRSIIMCRL